VLISYALHHVAGDVIAGEDDAAEDGGGWDVGDDIELPTDLVSCYTSVVILNFDLYNCLHS